MLKSESVLLRPRNNQFGEYQLKHLRYYFCTEGDKKIGFNYRNALAHWSGLQAVDITPFLVAKLMYLFTNVVNSVVIHFINKSKILD